MIARFRDTVEQFETPKGWFVVAISYLMISFLLLAGVLYTLAARVGADAFWSVAGLVAISAIVTVLAAVGGFTLGIISYQLGLRRLKMSGR